MSSFEVKTLNSTSFTNWIHFRSPHDLRPMFCQAFLLLSAMLIVLGIVYIGLLVIAIIIHHCCFDHDPKKVPDYVKKSPLFSDSESENEELVMGYEPDFKGERESVNRVSQPNSRKTVVTFQKSEKPMESPTKQ